MTTPYEVEQVTMIFKVKLVTTQYIQDLVRINHMDDWVMILLMLLQKVVLFLKLSMAVQELTHYLSVTLE